MRAIKLLVVYSFGYIQWYFLNAILLCLRFWLKIAGSLMKDEMMSIFRNPRAPVVIQKAFSDNAEITKGLDALVSWLMKVDEDGDYVNINQVASIMKAMPRYISTRGQVINISSDGRKAKYITPQRPVGATVEEYDDTNIMQSEEMSILFNCLRLHVSTSKKHS